jgi:osmoprotectant transport system ATP-binding protein
VIELRELTRLYGDAVAVDRLSLQVAAGETLVLLGGSGSGKTTTLKMINRLIEPTSGEIRVDGVDVRTLAAHELRRRIGYAFQAVGLFPHMTVAENVGVTPRLMGWDRDRIRERVDSLLRRVELEPEDYRERLPHELSGGQQQRVGIARAIAAEPALLLLDEPFGALDPLTRDRLQDWFLALCRELSLTVVFVTHDMLEALRIGDRIAVLRSGRLVQIGTPAEVLNAPADAEVAELLSTPRRQNEIFERLLAEGAP